MWYHRDFADKISLLAQHFPALVLSGARQSGKTSLLKDIFRHHNYISLDIPSIAEEAEHDPESFLKRYPPPILIDEIQYAPGIFRHIKIAIDKNRHDMGQFILTGSQKFTLMKEVSESLAGRCAVLDLENLSLHELKKSKNSEKNLLTFYDYVITRGTFPELWRDENIPSDVFYRSYLMTYLERDVRQILNVTSLRDFERFIRACAARNGQLLDQSALASDVGVSSKAIKSWLNVLQASNQVVLLEPWFANAGKRLVKTPKLYFCETGLLCYLLGVTKDNVSDSPFAGALWESFVFAELRKLMAVFGKSDSIWFYRDQQQVEADFMILGGGFARLLECKWHSRADNRDFKNLVKIRDNAQEKNLADFKKSKIFVISRTKYAASIGNESYFLPLTELLEVFSN
jgi:predicted AAA+ superfamily ATPase